MRATIGAIALCGALLATVPAAAERPCEIPGWPDERPSYKSLDFSWCSADVPPEFRQYAINAAISHCRGNEESVKEWCGGLNFLKWDHCACPDDMFTPEMVEAADAADAARAEEARREREQEAARIAAEEVARIASARPCKIPDYPNANPDTVPSLGFSWCPAEVDFQVRSYAIAVAGSYCAKLAGEPGKDWAAQIESLCEGLDNLEGRISSGRHCACPADLR